MLKVKSEKLLADIAEIKTEISQIDEAASRVANDIANQRGLGAEFAERLKEMIVEAEPKYHIADKQEKLIALMEYVEDVPEEVVVEKEAISPLA